MGRFHLLSAFGKRLAVCFAYRLALALGSYVIAENNGRFHWADVESWPQNMHIDAPVFGDQQQQRNAVLANFAFSLRVRRQFHSQPQFVPQRYPAPAMQAG